MSATFSTDPDSRASARSPFDGAVVVLGVCGSISAYKAVELCRRLVDGGAHVIPVLTKAATRFVGVTTFSALASEATKTDLFDDTEPIPHTRLGRSADLILVAPATATIMAQYAGGLANDLLSATLLCTTAPVIMCPAMHTEMWEHPAVQDNLATLRKRGVLFVEPESGRLAGGDVGTGRLSSPEAILDAAGAVLSARGDLSGLSVLVTAGGTREAIDPVRFIANRSSGKQGHAIARAARARGATVTLITTVNDNAPVGVTIVNAETAADVEQATLLGSQTADVVIMAAAVADFRPVSPASQKWKKRDGLPEIVLEETTDIVRTLAETRRAGQTIVGFAAETSHVEEEGRSKLESKGLDLIVVNDVSQPGVGFAHDTNAVVILTKDGQRVEVPLAPKSTIADAVIDEIVQYRRRSPELGATPTDAVRPANSSATR